MRSAILSAVYMRSLEAGFVLLLALGCKGPPVQPVINLTSKDSLPGDPTTPSGPGTVSPASPSLPSPGPKGPASPAPARTPAPAPAPARAPTPAPGPAAAPAPSPAPSLPTSFLPRVMSTRVTSSTNQTPRKGDELQIIVTVTNGGSVKGEVKISPRLTSNRFSDFDRVTLPTQTVSLNGGETKTANFKVGPFLTDTVKGKKYALGRGAYTVDLALERGIETSVGAGTKKFDIATSGVVFGLLMYDKKYFQIAEGRSGVDPVQWTNESLSRKATVYYPGSNSTRTFNGGLDEMLGIRHVFQAFGDLDFSSSNADSDLFGLSESTAKRSLGLVNNWVGICEGTCDENHGFDYMISLTPIFMGGVALSSSQVSGGFEYDQSKSRSQMVIAHESGHIFGAPHCDPLQGYMMCSGEKAESYKQNGDFLWHEDSLKAMNGKKYQ